VGLDLAADALRMLADFGETVVYVPREGEERTIQAIVERGDAAPVPGAADGLSPQVRLTVANDATEGIASSELDTGGDRVRAAPRVGGEARTMEITRILYHDSGALVLELR
jgi:hypothetical protein